ncbi:hypothetical protein QQP08_000091 [Theobroma cacao]|nr:hypothetical protein QQP08_000091 [Theobroma cacao]
MARVSLPLILRPPHLLRRRHRPHEAEPHLLPRELRHDCPGNPLPQPPMAPNLHDRLLGRLRRLVLPLLLPRRSLGHSQPYNRRPPRFGGPRRNYDRSPGSDRRLAERGGFRFDWGFYRGTPRSV